MIRIFVKRFCPCLPAGGFAGDIELVALRNCITFFVLHGAAGRRKNQGVAGVWVRLFCAAAGRTAAEELLRWRRLASSKS